jgi:outer membrane protein insertion porin family
VAGTAGYIVSYGDKALELNDRFFKGAVLSAASRSPVWALVHFSGPAVTDFLGEAYAIGTVELRFPNFLPEELGIKTSLFSDFGTVGMVADDDDTCLMAPQVLPAVAKCIKDDLSLRASAGVSVYWNSPFGPVRLDFSQVLNKEDYDQTDSASAQVRSSVRSRSYLKTSAPLRYAFAAATSH